MLTSKEKILNIGGNIIHLLHLPRPFLDNKLRLYAEGEDEGWNRFHLEWDLSDNFTRNGELNLNDPCVFLKKEI